MSLIVNLSCGLANRMFQYSYYLYLKKNGYMVQTDAYDSGVLQHEKVEWNRIFPQAVLSPASRMSVLLYGGGHDVFSRFRRRYLPSFTAVLQMPTAFEVQLPERRKAYIIGCFQNSQMVECVTSEIKMAFRFMPFEDDYNKNLADEIQKCESVGIHIRKGKDYQQRIWYQGTCPTEYYQKAVAYMKSHLSNPCFYIFADNKDWVGESLKGFDYKLIDGNPAMGYGNHFDMQLMSMCKYNIISNSTYSWWAAFLNSSKDKKVVMPKIWFNPQSCIEYTSDALFCKGWVQL